MVCRGARASCNTRCAQVDTYIGLSTIHGVYKGVDNRLVYNTRCSQPWIIDLCTIHADDLFINVVAL